MVDNKTPEQRSWNMSRIRGMNTGPEMTIRRLAHRRGLRYRVHVMALPGRPDMVFSRARVVVFIDGDFWHGWQFPRWKRRLSTYWQAKIARNRKRDRRNHRRLRAAGWKVVRIWEHEVCQDPDRCLVRIEQQVRTHGTGGCATVRRMGSSDRR